MAGLAERRDRSVGAERRRLTLLVHLAASAGDFSPKLAAAVQQATDAEVRVMSDLVDRGLSIPNLVNVLQGAHLVIGDDVLYERWIFPHSRKRLSSHHKTIDKDITPDYGVDGPLVRESLHGKAVFGTWVQLERTKATFQWGKLPSWHDVVHIKDFAIYRVTGKNVGPWGLSAHVDTRPMLLRPPTRTPGQGADQGLGAFAARRLEIAQGDADFEAHWSDLLTPDVLPVGPVGDLFAPPDPPDPHDLLPDSPFKDELGEGLFGSLALARSTATLPRGVAKLLDATEQTALPPSPEGPAELVTLRSGKTPITLTATVVPVAVKPVFLGQEDES